MYTTGQIAAKFGVSIKTIQRLDSDGILIPKRNQFNNRRIYDHNDIAKLTDILMQSKAGRKLGSDGARSNEAYTPTDALIEAIMSTCKAIRPELAQEFKEIIPSLGLDLSAIAEAGEYINKVFAQSVFAKAFLTT
jgi:DNA-binding transcriptional MerR regulator